jgi:hypothetical protein
VANISCQVLDCGVCRIGPGAGRHRLSRHPTDTPGKRPRDDGTLAPSRSWPDDDASIGWMT